MAAERLLSRGQNPRNEISVKPGLAQNDRTHRNRRTPQPLTPELDNGPGSDKARLTLLLVLQGEQLNSEPPDARFDPGTAA